MGQQRFTPEFKDEAVRQVTERGYKVVEVAVSVWASGVLTQASQLRAIPSTNQGSDEGHA